MTSLTKQLSSMERDLASKAEKANNLASTLKMLDQNRREASKAKAKLDEEIRVINKAKRALQKQIDEDEL